MGCWLLLPAGQGHAPGVGRLPDAVVAQAGTAATGLALQQPGGKVCATGGCRVILHIALHLCVHAKCAPLCVHAGGAGASGAVAGALQDSSAQAGELLLVMHCAAVNVH